MKRLISYIRQKPSNIFLYPSILLLLVTSLLLVLRKNNIAEVTAELSFYGLIISIIMKTVELSGSKKGIYKS